MLEALKGKRILVVDDDEGVRAMIADDLAGCEVDTAATHDEARRKLAALRYDLAVLDVMGVRGYELLEEFGARVPCIMLTARALQREDLDRAIAGRAVLFLPKEELAFLDEYAAKALVSREPLWPWLFRRVDFARWFGGEWSALAGGRAAGEVGGGSAP
jgi:CheY-like chemotaxis protein